ncbi:MAG: hypothetical protein OXG36_04065 [Caldilineaceae bacterium]|nr:hypothetical protein [Caldilineaceae bacterium]
MAASLEQETRTSASSKTMHRLRRQGAKPLTTGGMVANTEGRLQIVLPDSNQNQRNRNRSAGANINSRQILLLQQLQILRVLQRTVNQFYQMILGEFQLPGHAPEQLVIVFTSGAAGKQSEDGGNFAISVLQEILLVATALAQPEALAQQGLPDIPGLANSHSEHALQKRAEALGVVGQLGRIELQIVRGNGLSHCPQVLHGIFQSIPKATKGPVSMMQDVAVGIILSNVQLERFAGHNAGG